MSYIQDILNMVSSLSDRINALEWSSYIQDILNMVSSLSDRINALDELHSRYFEYGK